MTEEYKCGDNRFEIIAKAKEHLLRATNIEDAPEEMAVIDNILFRCWQMGWLKKYEEEPKDLEGAVRDWYGISDNYVGELDGLMRAARYFYELGKKGGIIWQTAKQYKLK